MTLLDCKPEITEVGKWAGEGAQATGGVCQWQATLVGFANADILAPIIEKLRARVRAGADTFLVKVKAHRGETLNGEADDSLKIRPVLQQPHHPITGSPAEL